MKTLKREEIYASKHDNLDHLRANVEEFIEEYYNRLRLHSALGYRTCCIEVESTFLRSSARHECA